MCDVMWRNDKMRGIEWLNQWEKKGKKWNETISTTKTIQLCKICRYVTSFSLTSTCHSITSCTSITFFWHLKIIRFSTINFIKQTNKQNHINSQQHSIINYQQQKKKEWLSVCMFMCIMCSVFLFLFLVWFVNVMIMRDNEWEMKQLIQIDID
jgi:hypothetical protein